MLVRKYLIGAEWLNNIMIILLYYVSGEFFAHLVGSAVGPVFLLISSVVIICLYLCRVYIDKLPVYLAGHILMYVAVFLIPMTFKYTLFTIVMLIVLSICDLFFWTGGTDRSFMMINPVLASVFAVVFIYASAKELPYLAHVAYICGICFLSLFFIRTYLLNGAKFASGMLINKNTPINDMFRHNSRLVFPLVGGFTAGMFILQSDTLAAVLSKAVRFIMNCVGRLMFFLLSLLPGAEEEERISYTQGKMELPPVSSFPTWLITLLVALEKVITVFAAGFIIYLAVKMAVRFFVIYFNRHGYELSRFAEDDHTETREQIKHKKRRRIRKLMTGKTDRDKIRKRYRNAVLRMCRHGYGLKRYHTPEERARDTDELFVNSGSDEFRELTGKYEMVRYYE